MTYYHGGVPGLRLGDELLPPSVTGRQDSAARIAREQLDTDYVREDRVYLGRTVDIASLYAAMYPLAEGGWLYEVKPSDDMEPDPDYIGDDPMDSVQCSRATIVRVIGPLAQPFVDSVRSAVMAGVA